jgi:AcrR family transcriptional regulator
MNKTSRTVPRRIPKQRRSRATVDAIVEAAAHLLAARGWEASTTNHIAERAGVSIGSLYKYFPNKSSILAGTSRATRPSCERAKAQRPSWRCTRALGG